jgi:hypothetical protein
VEAALLATYPGICLPERWLPGPGRDRSGPSLRRLLVLVRHLPAGSALDRAVNKPPEWSVLHQVLDDTRRSVVAALGVKNPAPHPLSPHAAKKGVLSPERLRVLRAAKARAEAHNNR